MPAKADFALSATDPHHADPHHAWAYRPAEPLQGVANGPLAGLTFSVKDLFGVEGWPLTASTRAALPPVPPSPLVTNLLELGATAVGKTHLHEIAMGILGEHPYAGEDSATLHPELAGHVAGGSSSGAGVSARLGQVDFALGTDTGGSIRVPAAWCGVYGYKPTKGHLAWPTAGVLPLSPTCDHAGPLSRDFSTIVRVHEALTGEKVAHTWRGVRVGVWRPQGWIDADIRGALDDMAARLEALGAKLHSDSIELPDMLDAYGPIVTGEAAEVHAEALAGSNPAFSPDILDKLRSGAALSPAEREAAYERRKTYYGALEAAFAKADIILAPITPTLPPKVGQHEVTLHGEQVNIRPAVLRLNAPFSMLGVPAVAVPTATPWAGVQLVAGWDEDTRLLGLVRELASTQP